MSSTAAPQPIRCLRPGCHRALTAPASIAAGYGPVCRRRIRDAAIAEAVKGFTAEQVEKAQQLIADGGLVPTRHPGVFRAVASDGTSTYLAHAATCNCRAGLRRRNPCYHSLAVRILAAATLPAKGRASYAQAA
jgi:Family of unknown function (DUF6011)